MTDRILKVLDRIESMRLRAQNNETYTADYVLRTAEAILASTFGYYGRSTWIEELRKMPTSELHKRSYR